MHVQESFLFDKLTKVSLWCCFLFEIKPSHCFLSSACILYKYYLLGKFCTVSRVCPTVSVHWQKAVVWVMLTPSIIWKRFPRGLILVLEALKRKLPSEQHFNLYCGWWQCRTGSAAWDPALDPSLSPVPPHRPAASSQSQTLVSLTSNATPHLLSNAPLLPISFLRFFLNKLGRLLLSLINIFLWLSEVPIFCQMIHLLE